MTDANLAATTQAASQVMNIAFAAGQNKKDRQFNKDMAEYAYEKNLEMWNMQNAYNTPAAQMQRFKDAGLNPALMYGRGESGNAGSMPDYQAPQGAFGLPEIDLASAFSLFQDIKQKAAQTDNIKKQNMLIDEQTASAIFENLRKVYELNYDYGGIDLSLDSRLSDKYGVKNPITKGESRKQMEYEISRFNYNQSKRQENANDKYFYDSAKMEFENKRREWELANQWSSKEREIAYGIQEFTHKWLKSRQDLYDESKGMRVLGEDNIDDRILYDMFKGKNKAGAAAGAGATTLMSLLMMLRQITGGRK